MKENRNKIEIITCEDLPTDPDPKATYWLVPKDTDDLYYWERVDRNVGWITKEEQELLRRSTIGIAGCGGIGGQLAEKFLRLGVGEIRITDVENFDVTNINRQFAACRRTVGKSKAFETARMVREISDDSSILVYPQGICEDTVERFVSGCDVICDCLEFWAVGARILLDKVMREHNLSMFNAPTIGFGTRVFFFTPTSATMEDCLGLTLEEGYELQRAIQGKKATPEMIRKAMDSVIRGLLPELPEYYQGNREYFNKRLFEEGRASIIATNPPMATGVYAGRVLLHLLRNSGVKRNIVEPPEMPGYLYIDHATMESKVVKKKWW